MSEERLTKIAEALRGVRLSDLVKALADSRAEADQLRKERDEWKQHAATGVAIREKELAELAASRSALELSRWETHEAKTWGNLAKEQRDEARAEAEHLRLGQKQKTIAHEQCLLMWQKERDALKARVGRLTREVEVLRQYGNKDCTTMADEALAADQEPKG